MSRMELPTAVSATCDITNSPYTLSTEQAANAATIAAVATARRLPARATTIALATALQESKLVNVEYGDRDSVGLFQQRPSQGWGSAGQILDPRYSAGRFFDALLKVPRWQQLALTVAAQKVQASAHPTAYEQWEDQAAVLTRAFTGAAPAMVSCSFPEPTVAAAPARVLQLLALGAAAHPDRQRRAGRRAAAGGAVGDGRLAGGQGRPARHRGGGDGRPALDPGRRVAGRQQRRQGPDPVRGGADPAVGLSPYRPGQPARRSAAASTRSSVAVSATRTWRPPAGP